MYRARSGGSAELRDSPQQTQKPALAKVPAGSDGAVRAHLRMDALEIAGSRGGPDPVRRQRCRPSKRRGNAETSPGRTGCAVPDATVTDSRAGMGIGPSRTTMDQLTVGLSRVFARPVSSPEARYHQ